MKKHRLYTFVNFLYMSQKQWGIQTAHVTSTLMAKARQHPAMDQAAMEWANHSPTIIMCKAHNVAELLRLERDIGSLAENLHLPFAAFREDQDSLGGVITCVGVLVPEEMFSLVSRFQENEATFHAPELCAVDFSGIKGGLPVTSSSHPTTHALLSIVKTAELA